MCYEKCVQHFLFKYFNVYWSNIYCHYIEYVGKIHSKPKNNHFKSIPTYILQFKVKYNIQHLIQGNHILGFMHFKSLKNFFLI